MRGHAYLVETFDQNPLHACLDESGLDVAARGNDEPGHTNSNDAKLLLKPLREIVIFRDRDRLESVEGFEDRALDEDPVVAEEDRVARMIIIPKAKVEEASEPLDLVIVRGKDI